MLRIEVFITEENLLLSCRDHFILASLRRQRHGKHLFLYRESRAGGCVGNEENNTHTHIRSFHNFYKIEVILRV